MVVNDDDRLHLLWLLLVILLLCEEVDIYLVPLSMSTLKVEGRAAAAAMAICRVGEDDVLQVFLEFANHDCSSSRRNS